MGGVSFHPVKSGDTLSKIARDNNMTLNQLLELNPQFKANPNQIQVGQRVNLTKNGSVFTASKQATNGTRGVGQQATANPNRTDNPDGTYTIKDPKTGTETTFFANGKKKSVTSYQATGEKSWTKEYDENGKLKSITDYDRKGKATQKEEYVYDGNGLRCGTNVISNPEGKAPAANPDQEKPKGFLASLPVIGQLFG